MKGFKDEIYKKLFFKNKVKKGDEAVIAKYYILPQEEYNKKDSKKKE